MKAANLKLILPLALLALFVVVFRAPLRERIRNHFTLANPAPTVDAVSDMIEQATDRRAALLAAWNSGGLVHREVAIGELRRIFPMSDKLPPEFEALLLSAALDPDLDVRERAFATLRERQHPALLALAAEQLRDVDPTVRLLGLAQLKWAPAAIGVPLAAAQLDDPDVAVVGESAKLLEHWSGQSFGFKLADTVAELAPDTGLLEYPAAGTAKTLAAAQKAKVWWLQHQGEFPPPRLSVPAAARNIRLVPAGNFSLPTLEGRFVGLSDFPGKVVLLNFWTTWCTACVGEIPELVALQNSHSNQLVVLGVSLDLLPDDDGDLRPDPKTVPQKVARTAKARGMNYPILLDAYNEAGGRFNGGELPTTVIIDAQGKVRRRFVGTRTLPVFAAMIAEAGRPASGQDRQP